MLKATINSQTFDIQSNKSEISVNSQPFKWDMVEIKDGNFHILYNNRSFNAEVLEADYQTKSFLIKRRKYCLRQHYGESCLFVSRLMVKDAEDDH